jgi:dihydropteroate synthase
MSSPLNISMRSSLNRGVIMGILNVTPDSFSDGGSYFDLPLAVSHALEMIDHGADIIDIGGESTRPGSNSVSEQDQISRIVPVISALREKISDSIIISVDTTRSIVAEASVVAGASIVNDISSGLDDPAMLPTVSRLGVGIVLMHMQGKPQTMQINPQYGDVVSDVKLFLHSRAREAIGHGIDRKKIMIDPGIGFGKTKAHNLALLSSLRAIVDLGYPVLLGASRKRFMGSICNESNPEELLGATLATTVYALSVGVKVFRVHDVKANRQALDVMAHISAVQR